MWLKYFYHLRVIMKNTHDITDDIRWAVLFKTAFSIVNVKSEIPSKNHFYDYQADQIQWNLTETMKWFDRFERTIKNLN